MDDRLKTASNQYCTSKDKLCADATVVWFEKSSKDNQEKSVISRIKEQVKQVEVFDEIDDCVDYISSLEDDMVLFIMSSTFGNTIVPLIYEIPSIQAIYIYCETCSTCETWNDETCKKVVGVFNTQHQLVSAICDRTNDFESSFTSKAVSDKSPLIQINKRVVNEANKLRNCTSIILEKTPLDEPDTGERLSFIVRVLPKSEPYVKGSYRVQITLPAEYPFKAPELRFLTRIYHPNIYEYGGPCCCCFEEKSYHPRMTLIEILERLVEVIDNPVMDCAANCEAGYEYSCDRTKFMTTASKMVNDYALPRLHTDG